MKVSELIERKAKLEDDIAETVTRLLKEFEEDSQMEVKNLFVVLSEISLDGNGDKYITQVKASVKLGL